MSASLRSRPNLRTAAIRRCVPIADPCSAIKLQSYGNLFDHLVGTSKKRCRNVQPERVCGLEVDDKLELSRLLDRKIASTFACKDSGDISRGGAIKLEVVGRVAH